MKVKTVKYITYGTFLISALVIIFAFVLPVPSNYTVMIMYFGGAIGILGMFFCIRSLWYQLCPKCNEFMITKKKSLDYCPCCNDRWLNDE